MGGIPETVWLKRFVPPPHIAWTRWGRLLIEALCARELIVIRVVCRWKVKEEDFTSFQEVWSRTTSKIHETVPGALGSFMLRNPEDKTEVITVAKWDSVERWRAFWGSENPS